MGWGRRVLNRFKAWRSRSADLTEHRAGHSLPPGVDEVRLLETDHAAGLAELAAVLTVLDQAIGAMRILIQRRTNEQPDAVVDIALLQFAVVQFVGCFKGGRGSRRLKPKQAFDGPGSRFFEHLAALADQLSGAHARLTGQTEVVVLLKRAPDRVGVLGLATRSRRPDRLTIHELSNIADFMDRGRDAYAAAAGRQRELASRELELMSNATLLALAMPVDQT